MKNLKKVHRVKFLSVELKQNKLFIEIAKLYSDKKTVKNEKYILKSEIINKLKKASTQKEFATLVNDSFVAIAKLDAQAKKQQLTENTYYCASRNYIALAMSKLQFAEVAFRQRHEAHATMKKVKASKKQIAKHIAKVRATAKK